MGLIGGMMGSSAAKKQAEAMKKIAEGYGKVGKWQYQQISPWMNAGKGALTAQMQMLANPLNSQAALSDYYAGPQYAQEEQQAQYALNSNAEATRTMGATATGNALASQSVSLGQNYLKGLNQQRGQQMKTLGGISSQGLGATKTMGDWAYQDYNSAANLLSGAAAATAGGKASEAGGIASGIGGLLNAAIGAFGTGAAGGFSSPTQSMVTGGKSAGSDINWGNIAKTAGTVAMSFI